MEEIELMDIAEKIIPILRAKNLTYNQAKEVLECCEFLLGDECRMSCEGMRLLQFLKRKKLQSKCRRLIRKNFSKDEIIRPKKRAFRKAYQEKAVRGGGD